MARDLASITAKPSVQFAEYVGLAWRVGSSYNKMRFRASIKEIGTFSSETFSYLPHLLLRWFSTITMPKTRHRSFWRQFLIQTRTNSLTAPTGASGLDPSG